MLKRSWSAILAAVDNAINSDIDKSIADKPMALPREVPTILTGLSPVKLLDSYGSIRGQALLRKEAIEAEIRRLTGELDNTNVALDAMDAAIGVLEANNPVALTEAELELDFSPHPDQTSPMTVERERYVTGHTSSERRLEEYAKRVADEIGGSAHA